MNDVQQRYQLIIEYADAKDQPFPGLSYSVSAATGLHTALLPFFAIPIDQLHPDTAKANGFSSFVKNVTVLDLVSGQPLISNFYLPDKDRRIFDAVHLVLEANVTPQDLRVSGEYFPGRASVEDPAITPLVSWHPSATHMVAEPIYHDLFEQTMKHGIAAHASLLPFPFQVQVQGAQLEGAIAANNQLDAPAITITHFFQLLDDALLFALHLDPYAFHHQQAFGRGLPVYISEASVVDSSQDEKTVARLSYQQLTGGSGQPPGGAVILAYDRQLDKHMRAFGIGSSASPESEMVLYQQNGDGVFTASTEFSALRQRLDRNGQQQPALAFESVTTMQISGFQDLHGKPAAIIEQHRLHTNHLPYALLDLLLKRPEYFFTDHSPQHPITITDAEVRIAQGRPLCHLSSQPPVKSPLVQGVYLGMTSELLNHPAIAHLDPVRMTSVPLVAGSNGLNYAHVYPQTGKGPALEEFKQLYINSMADSISRQLSQRQDLHKWQPAMMGSNPSKLQIALNWELNTSLPVTGSVLTTATFAPASLLQALKQLEKLGADLFEGAELANQELPLRLRTAALWDVSGATPALLLQKLASQQGTPETFYQIHSPHPDLITAFKIAIGDDKLGDAMRHGANSHPPRPSILNEPQQKVWRPGQ